MTLVAGVDSSTQSCKVVVCDGATGAVVRQGSAPHPEGTEIDPAFWLTALDEALRAAGGLDGVAAIAVAAQQHGMVCLDEHGTVVRPALLWNDTRSAAAAVELVDELGGPEKGARVGRRRRQRPDGLVHRDEAALARRARTGPRGADDRGVPSPRLADLAARRWSGRSAARRDGPRDGPG